MDIQEKKIITMDKQVIALSHYRNDKPKVIVLAHGFYNNKDAYLFKKIAQEIAVEYDVVSFDFRGHGKSGGLFTWTAREINDLTVVLEYVKQEKYSRTGLMGFSLGAAISIVAAAKDRAINSLIVVSAPYDFWQINMHFWEPEMLNDLKLNLGMKGKGKFIRPGNVFLKKPKPINFVADIAPTPVLFIHGANDWIVKPLHSQKLYEAAQEPKKIKMINGVGHAEKIFDDKHDEFMAECLGWFGNTL